LHRVALTAEQIFDRTSVVDVCISDQTYFGEVLFRASARDALPDFVSRGMDKIDVSILIKMLTDNRAKMRSLLVSGCRDFDALIAELRKRDATPLLKSGSARYLHGDRSVVIPFSISEKL